MHARFSKEPKYCGLRKARTPQTHPMLAGNILVVGCGPKFIAKVRFSEKLVTLVGACLPYGVCEEHPAFLKLVRIPNGCVWRLFAYYGDKSRRVLLWEYNKTPSWLDMDEVRYASENPQDEDANDRNANDEDYE